MTPCAFVGDVHGDVERLAEVRETLHSQRDRTVVLLGDYVNLGPNPAGVIDLLCRWQRDLGERLVLLEGNHDRALLSVIDGGDVGELLALGGATTVKSYVGEVNGDVGAALRSAVPRKHVELLRSLQETWLAPDVIATHQWPTYRINLDRHFVVLGHYYQPGNKPHVDEHVAYLDTGCGSHADGVLTCFLYPEREWYVV